MANPKSRGPAAIGHLTHSIHALKLIRAWKECAGPALAAQVTFLGIHEREQKKILALEVKDPLWRQELEYQKASILSVYRQKLTSLGLHESALPQHIELLAHSSLLVPRKPFTTQQGRKK